MNEQYIREKSIMVVMTMPQIRSYMFGKIRVSAATLWNCILPCVVWCGAYM